MTEILATMAMLGMEVGEHSLVVSETLGSLAARRPHPVHQVEQVPGEAGHSLLLSSYLWQHNNLKGWS